MLYFPIDEDIYGDDDDGEGGFNFGGEDGEDDEDLEDDGDLGDDQEGDLDDEEEEDLKELFGNIGEG